MKFSISILFALLINLLLFLAIQKLVQPEHAAFNLPDLVTLVEFIRLKQEDKIIEPKLREKLPDKPKQPKKPPPPPKLKQPELEKPKPQKVKPPSPEVKLPLQMTGGPHLGEFLRAPKPKKKPLQKPAPIPEPVIEPEPEPVVEQFSEQIDSPPDESDTGPAEPEVPEIETDVVPSYRSKPKYPSRAMRAGIEGVVTVEFTITPDGTVIDPVIISANPPKIFDKSVLIAIKKWKFKPRIINGKPVSRRARQDINFNLK